GTSGGRSGHWTATCASAWGCWPSGWDTRHPNPPRNRPLLVVGIRAKCPQTSREMLSLSGHTTISHNMGRVSFSPDGLRLATTGSDLTARVWDLRTGKELFVLSGHTDFVLTATYSPDGKLIATTSDDNTVRIWDPATGKPVQVLRGHIRETECVAFS